MRSALGELVLEGITTNLDFQFQILDDEDFINGNFDTSFIEKKVSDGKRIRRPKHGNFQIHV